MLPPKPQSCKACPFRINCLPGYLGDDEPAHFLHTACSEEEMPCHTGINYENKNWKLNLNKSHQCSGRAIFLANIFKMPRNPDIKRLPADRINFFKDKEAFTKHHTEMKFPEVTEARMAIGAQ